MSEPSSSALPAVGPAAGPIPRSKTPAAIGLVFAIFFWGTQLPIAQQVLQSVDQYYFAVIRYGVGIWLFVITLYVREGWKSFGFEGKGVLLAWHGLCGFTAFGLLVFWGLYFTTPAHVSIILASQPLLTALWMWLVRRRRPPAATMACIGVAFVGLLLIITRGDLQGALKGGSLVGDALALAGAVCWVIYTLGQARFPQWSSFRYATLANIVGTLGILAVVLPLTLAGVAHVPSWDTLVAQGPALLYIAVFPLYVSIMLFGIAVARLGALNTLLAGNGTPVVVFAIEAARGRLPTAIEWVGAALVIAALAANNLLARRAA
jgi:drug/metabolite transporter (DMT)-like permease